MAQALPKREFKGSRDKTDDKPHRELSILKPVALALSKPADWQGILRQALRCTVRSMAADAGLVYLVQGETLALKVSVGRPLVLPEPLRESVLAGRACLAKLAATLTGGLLAQDPEAKGHAVQSWVSAPLRSNGRTLGLIVLARRGPNAFGSEDWELLETIASQLAVATENARLYAEVKALAEQLEQKVEDRTRELHEAQERLLRSERLAAIGELASGVGHELRNPLGVINNSAFFLTIRLGNHQDEKVRKHLAILQRQVNIANRIIIDLLEFARPKEPTFEELDINGVVEQALSGIEVPAGVEVEVRPQDDVPCLLADREQMRRVFVNLITNAFQAMSQGGRLVVSTAREGQSVTITFDDTGVGIPEENLTKIFEPLFTTKPKGVGLGLAICRNIVDRHDGKIEARSRVGQGAAFTVRLPLFTKQEAA